MKKNNKLERKDDVMKKIEEEAKERDIGYQIFSRAEEKLGKIIPIFNEERNEERGLLQWVDIPPYKVDYQDIKKEYNFTVYIFSSDSGALKTKLLKLYENMIEIGKEGIEIEGDHYYLHAVQSEEKMILERRSIEIELRYIFRKGG